MKAGIPTPGLHLEGHDDVDDGDVGPLGLTAYNNNEARNIIAVRVPLDSTRSPFYIYGTPEQILAFAAELAGAVADHRTEAA
jgi:hypothetical protein